MMGGRWRNLAEFRAYLERRSAEIRAERGIKREEERIRREEERQKWEEERVRCEQERQQREQAEWLRNAVSGVSAEELEATDDQLPTEDERLKDGFAIWKSSDEDE
jgi:hypothetical protein